MCMSREIFSSMRTFFPLHPFAQIFGSRFYNELLLLPSYSSTTTSDNGETHIDDYMPLYILPVDTNNA
jgi:hypothetical protein